jgi:hypothetical protein
MQMASIPRNPAHTSRPRSCRSKASLVGSAAACDHTTCLGSVIKQQHQVVHKAKPQLQATALQLRVKYPPKISKTTRCIFAKSVLEHRNRSCTWISILGLQIFGYVKSILVQMIDTKIYRSGPPSSPRTSSARPILRTSRSLSTLPSRARSRSLMARRGRSPTATLPPRVAT